MKWADLKQMTTRELLDYGDRLAAASSVENGPAQSGILAPSGVPIEDDAKELLLDFLDAVTPFDGMVEAMTDAAIQMAGSQTGWVDKALGLLRFVTPLLDAKPLANLPI